jgi:hypothetical protein
MPTRLSETAKELGAGNLHVCFMADQRYISPCFQQPARPEHLDHKDNSLPSIAIDWDQQKDGH